LRNLHELTANLVQEEKETIKNTETAAAIYEEQLIETKENIIDITKQLSRAQTARKGLLKSRTSMEISPKVDENKAKLVNKELEETRSRELKLQKELEELKAKFQRDTELKKKKEKEKKQAGLNLEMKHHVAMMQKEKIIQAFKSNLQTIDKVVSQERTRHRANLLKKLALRRRRRLKGNGKGLPNINGGARPVTSTGRPQRAASLCAPPKRAPLARPNTTVPGIRSRLPKKQMLSQTVPTSVGANKKLVSLPRTGTRARPKKGAPRGVPPPPKRAPPPAPPKKVKKGW